MRRLTRSQARRAVLGRLGLVRGRPEGRIDIRHFRRIYADLGVVQIDPINVLARAHHQVAFSRLGPYDTEAWDRYIWRSGEVYEGWVHVDATAPVAAWPLLAHRRRATLPWRAVKAVMDHRPAYLQQVLDEVAERGELSAADLHDQGERLGSWGSRSMGRAALDYHHLRGDLAISWRDGAMTAYFDLAERVLPAAVREAPVPPEREAQRALLRRAIAAVGVGTVGDLADHHRQHAPTARGLLSAMARDGEIVEVEVERWRGPVYADPDLVIPRAMPAATLLNPFDPVMWNRSRVKRLFDLDYRVEIYTPADQRRFGYYVLPFLLGEHLVALMDLKHDRAAGVLRVQTSHLHPDPSPDHPPPEVVCRALIDELGHWAAWLGAGEIVVADAGDLAARLHRTLTSA